MKLGVNKWLVRVIQAMYEGAVSRVRANHKYSDEFSVQIGIH